MVTYYGDYFRKVNFEIEPLLTKIFSEEYAKENAGSKIKDPLVYLFQMIDELNIESVENVLIAYFLKQQGMDLFNQPNQAFLVFRYSILVFQLFNNKNLRWLTRVIFLKKISIPAGNRF